MELLILELRLKIFKGNNMKYLAVLLAFFTSIGYCSNTFPFSFWNKKENLIPNVACRVDGVYDNSPCSDISQYGLGGINMTQTNDFGSAVTFFSPYTINKKYYCPGLSGTSNMAANNDVYYNTFLNQRYKVDSGTLLYIPNGGFPKGVFINCGSLSNFELKTMDSSGNACAVTLTTSACIEVP